MVATSGWLAATLVSKPLRTVVDEYAATVSPSMLGWRVGCFISLPVIVSCRISLSVIASCSISVPAVALPIYRPIFFRLLGTGRGALRLTLGIQRLHRNDLVGSRFFLSVDRFQVHAVPLNFEFTFMADGQKRRMLRIQRTNVVFHFVGSEQILGAQLLVRVYVLYADGSKHATQAREAPFLCATGNGLHALHHAPWGALFLFLALRDRGNRQNQRQH